RLDLDDHAARHGPLAAVDEHLADELARHVERRTSVEAAGKFHAPDFKPLSRATARSAAITTRSSRSEMSPVTIGSASGSPASPKPSATPARISGSGSCMWRAKPATRPRASSARYRRA